MKIACRPRAVVLSPIQNITHLSEPASGHKTYKVMVKNTGQLGFGFIQPKIYSKDSKGMIHISSESIQWIDSYETKSFIFEVNEEHTPVSIGFDNLHLKFQTLADIK